MGYLDVLLWNGHNLYYSGENTGVCFHTVITLTNTRQFFFLSRTIILTACLQLYTHVSLLFLPAYNTVLFNHPGVIMPNHVTDPETPHPPVKTTRSHSVIELSHNEHVKSVYMCKIKAPKLLSYVQENIRV